jgi:molybdenum cofactor cytidylyltransferase
MTPEIVGILLAAGLGTRYDPTGRELKLLTPARRGPHVGTPIAAAAARTLLGAVPRVTAVVRPADSDAQRQLHALLRSEGCTLAVCHNADAGMSASIARGVQAEERADGWIITLADMPAIEASTVRAIVGLLLEGALTAAPMFRGQRGHPVGFAARLLTQLLALGGDAGARPVLEAHPPRLIEVEDPGVLYDVDTVEENG